VNGSHVRLDPRGQRRRLDLYQRIVAGEQRDLLVGARRRRKPVHVFET
jgi:hypothetical protein